MPSFLSSLRRSNAQSLTSTSWREEFDTIPRVSQFKPCKYGKPHGLQPRGQEDFSHTTSLDVITVITVITVCPARFLFLVITSNLLITWYREWAFLSVFTFAASDFAVLDDDIFWPEVWALLPLTSLTRSTMYCVYFGFNSFQRPPCRLWNVIRRLVLNTSWLYFRGICWAFSDKQLTAISTLTLCVVILVISKTGKTIKIWSEYCKRNKDLCTDSWK